MEKSHRYITVERADGKDERFQLNRLLVKERAVVCRGTSCFSTSEGVAKFSWHSAKRQPSEVRHLKTGREKGVEGVATLVGHREITTIADLRVGLQFSQNTQYSFQTTTHDRCDGYDHPSGPDSSGSSRKRKFSDDHKRSSTRRRFNSRKSGVRQAHGGPTDEEKEADESKKPSLYIQDRNDSYENQILSCLIISPDGSSAISSLLENYWRRS